MQTLMHPATPTPRMIHGSLASSQFGRPGGAEWAAASGLAVHGVVQHRNPARGLEDDGVN